MPDRLSCRDERRDRLGRKTTGDRRRAAFHPGREQRIRAGNELARSRASISPGQAPAEAPLRATGKVKREEKFSLFSDYSNPRIVGEVNESQVKLVKLKGEFIWQHQENEDELFLVVKGSLVMKPRERDVMINAGNFLSRRSGVEHSPVAEPEAHILLIEPKGTLHTGNVRNEKTVETLAAI